MNNFDNWFKVLYGTDETIINYQINRYLNLSEQYNEVYKSNDEVKYFSAPGRSELSGNHTDHNGGRVIAASINLDSIACAAPQNDKIEIFSIGFDEHISVDLSQLDVIDDEKGTSTGLVRGVAAGFKKRGYEIGGFAAVVSSDVLVGSGLSSSASFEVLIGVILNHFYNDDKIPMPVVAGIGQFAENEYFGKPCGLMDQVACAVGGVVTIDFKEKENPVIEMVDFDLSAHGFKLAVVDTGGSHQNLTDDYASIPMEMREIAAFFDKENCSQIDYKEFIAKIPELHNSVSDRAILRALHFFNENNRVISQVQALLGDNFEEFLKLVNESGDSSFKYLQNIYTPKAPAEQPLSLALAITESFIKVNEIGACRVHGGGFAGTILVFLPEQFIEEYKKLIEPVFGNNSVAVLDIRNTGAVVLD